MKDPERHSSKWLIVTMLCAGIALAGWETYDLWRLISLSHSISMSFSGQPGQNMTVTPILLFGLIPAGQFTVPLAYIITAFGNLAIGVFLGAILFLLIRRISKLM